MVECYSLQKRPKHSDELSCSQVEHEQSMESNLRNRIEQIMSRFVGFDKVRSEVDVLLNFTEVETTYEDFDRENLGGLTRSEVLNIDETEVSSGEGGPQAGTFVQAPEQTEAAPEQSKQVSSSTTRNYELDREIRYVKQQVGVIDYYGVRGFDRDIFADQRSSSRR